MELREYFAGRRKSFVSRCDIDRLPPFTQAVLRLTAKIPYGRVRSYQWLARRLGKPKAARAVGNALARNPIPIFIPCHRIVRRDGAIGNFLLGSGWKKRLLDLEKSFVKT
jgi:methylated-DNA-[protein]-cysteine S-methyltransferase